LFNLAWFNFISDFYFYPFISNFSEKAQSVYGTKIFIKKGQESDFTPYLPIKSEYFP
jgi:hypothetical protein